MQIEWIPSPNYSARTAPITGIVIHWWDDPAKHPSFDGAVATLINPTRGASAHYVVSDRRVAQLVKEEHASWHAGPANPSTIGIEVDPNTPGATYDTVIELVRGICQRHGINPLTNIKGHNHYMATQCPGTLDLARIRNGANQQGGTVTEEDIFKNCYITQAQKWPSNTEIEAWKKSGLEPYTWVQRNARNIAADQERLNAFKACWMTLRHDWPSEDDIKRWQESSLSAYTYCQRFAPNVIALEKDKEIQELKKQLDNTQVVDAANAQLGRRFRELVEEIKN